jgi:hypothetical protein
MSEPGFCVYSHSANRNVFYVGSGAKSRAFDKSGRNVQWREHVQNVGAYEVQFHAQSNDRDEAISIEAALIDELSPSCNMIKPGHVHTKGLIFNFSVSMTESDAARVEALAAAHRWRRSETLNRLVVAALDGKLVK